MSYPKTWNDPHPWRPRNLAVAKMALSRRRDFFTAPAPDERPYWPPDERPYWPWPLADLEPDQRDLLIVSLPYWPWPADEYHEASRRLAGHVRYQGRPLSESDLAGLIRAVAPKLWEPMHVFPNGLRGRPRKTGPWRPCDFDWRQALNLILPTLLRNRAKALENTREPREALLGSRGPEQRHRVPGLIRTPPSATAERAMWRGWKKANPPLRREELKEIRRAIREHVDEASTTPPYAVGRPTGRSVPPARPARVHHRRDDRTPTDDAPDVQPAATCPRCHGLASPTYHDCAEHLRTRLRWRRGDDPVEYVKMLGATLATVIENQQRHDAEIARLQRLLAERRPDDAEIHAAVDRLIEEALAS